MRSTRLLTSAPCVPTSLMEARLTGRPPHMRENGSQEPLLEDALITEVLQRFLDLIPLKTNKANVLKFHKFHIYIVVMLM